MTEQAYSHPVPEQLFIPPNALHLLLEVFSGPMDLLLYLIKRHRMDIQRINVALISEQYIAYIERIKDSDFVLIAEYLQMAAWLTELKSRSLFPDDAMEDEEEGDPAEVLQQRLEKYMYFRRIAELLGTQARHALAHHYPTPHKELTPYVERPALALTDVASTMTRVLERQKLHAQHQVSRPQLSVMERMSHIQQLVMQKETLYSDCFSAEERIDGVVVVLLAVLSLLKHKAIDYSVREGDRQIMLHAY